MENSSASDHSTHCAGTICGRGLINPTARGMAPNAKIYSYNFSGNIQSEMTTAIPALGLNVSSHSYGSTQTCGLTGSGVAYSATSVATDVNLNNFPYHLHVHSAGNSQSACTGGWSTITSSGKTAKNNILVANITSTEALSTSSSCGPVADGRVKPEISAMGTSVFSTTTPLNAYTTMSGTSMATPGVAGSIALLVQRYKQLNSNQLPLHNPDTHSQKSLLLYISYMHLTTNRHIVSKAIALVEFAHTSHYK
jgi:subtilisin family serine protease